MDALGIEWSLLIAQLVNFALLIVLLRMFLYQPILNMLAARKERIVQSMKDAERVSAAAREAEADKGKVLDEARREGQEIRAQATRDAEKIAQDVRSRAEQEATEIRMKAQADAQKQVELALSDANKQIADQYLKGYMGEAAGLEWVESTHVPVHTVGPLGGTPLVKGASQGTTTGTAETTSLLTDGWTSAAAAEPLIPASASGDESAEDVAESVASSSSMS